MKIRHCDICGKPIEKRETYYRFVKHWWNGFQQENIENIDMCRFCFKDIQKMKKGENNEEDKSRNS